VIARLRTALGSAVAGSLASAVAIQGFVLITGVLAARLLGPQDRGYLALIWTVTLVVSQLGTCGLPLAVTYEIAGRRATPRSLLRDLGPTVRLQIVGFTALQALLTVGLVAVTATPALAAFIAIPVVPASLLQSYVFAGLQGAQQFGQFNVLRPASVAVYAVGLVGLAAVGSPGLAAVSAAWVVGWIVSGAFCFSAGRRAIRVAISADDAVQSASPAEMRRFGLQGLFGWVSPTETLRIDQLAVGLVLSAYDLGLYVAALAVTNLPRFLAQAVGTVAYPRIAAAQTEDERRYLLWRYVALGSALSVGVSGVIFLAADPLVRLAFGDTFSSSVGPLRILLLATVILCVRRVLAEAMRGAGYVGATSRAEAVSWISLVPTLPLGLIYDLDGVAIALCISYALGLYSLLRTLGSVPGRRPALLDADPPPATGLR